ncbi:MAG: phosphotransferase enzyme family protein [Verrucomicrobiales bacterium]
MSHRISSGTPASAPIPALDRTALVALAGQFDLGASASDCAPVRFDPVGIGHINQSVIVTTAGSGRFFLQRINQTVFPSVAALMENLERVTDHLQGKGRASLEIVPARTGERFIRDAEAGECWRVFRFVEGSTCITGPSSPGQAQQAAEAFGQFAGSLADLPAPRLHTIIPDFHNTPKRLADFLTAVDRDAAGRAAGARAEIGCAIAGAGWVGGRGVVGERGGLPLRVAHNDAKLENILFDAQASRAICVVDLDTVMPGSLLHDFGDLVRSAAATAGEEERDPERVGASRSMFAALARGFISACGNIMTDAERAELPIAGRLLAYEQALRFLTDHLDGDAYYRIGRVGQNLDRARNQLALAAAFEAEESAFVEICGREFDRG